MLQEPQNIEQYRTKRPMAFKLGAAMSGIAAPYLGDFQWAARQEQLRLQQEQADMEYQKYIMKQKGIDPLTALILDKINPDLAGEYIKSGDISSKATMTPSGSLGDLGDLKLSTFDAGAANLKNIKLSGQEAVAKEKATTEYQSTKGLNRQSRFIKGWSEAYQEITDKFPQAGDIGVEGKLSRIGASISEKLDQLPKTKGFLRRIKVLANKQARTVEGGRVTDQDRQVYADAMVDLLGAPNETNIGLASDTILDMYEEGGDITKLLIDLSSSGDDIMNSVLERVLDGMSEEDVKEFINAQ